MFDENHDENQHECSTAHCDICKPVIVLAATVAIW